EEEIRGAVMEEVERQFRPEFINRIDDVVVFASLRREDMAAIAGIQLERLRSRLEDQDLRLEIEPDAMQALVEQGYDPVFGARPLKRAIQRRLENPLSAALLGGRFVRGETSGVSHDGGGMAFAAVDGTPA
ncbi:MAG: hypothetical protein OXH09_00875, partial [Gammaproteobacteria bacterium]|nr:hypothetical protein [Gammaproteobacteria bacterium]